MSGDGPKGPRLSEEGARERAARQARQAEALRENLSKRKAQTRGRAAGTPEDGGAAKTGPDDAPGD